MSLDNISISNKYWGYEVLFTSFFLRLISILFFTSLFCTAYAQNNKYQFSHLDINNGLSHNQVNCIYKDSKGFMWFGTLSGLNRFDGYNFKIFKHDEKNKSSIIDDYIVNIFDGPDQKLWVLTRNGYSIYDPETEQFSRDLSPILLKITKRPYVAIPKILKDSKGNFWFVSTDSGVYKYNELSGQSLHYSHNAGTQVSLFSNSVVDIAEDSKGNIWFVYNTGVIEKLDIKLNKITYRTTLISRAENNKVRTYSITIDCDNDVWFYAPFADMGVYYLNPLTNKLRYIDSKTKGVRLNNNIINNIVQADDGLIWIATDHGGINVLDKKDFKITYLLNRVDDSKSLAQNSVTLYRDNSGIMWAATFKEGISYYHKNIFKFPLYRHFASDPNSLNFEDVDSFAEDKLGNLWIGTNGGGLIYFNRSTGKYTQYRHDPNNSSSLSNDIIVSLYIDHDQKLWIGTYFGGLDSFDGKTFTHYIHNDKIATSISDNRIWCIIEDASHRLLIGTFAGGLDIFDRSRKIFYHPYDQTKIQSPFVTAIFEDKEGNIWIGGYFGVDVIMKRTGSIIHYIHNSQNINSLVGDNVNGIIQDGRGLIWIATRNGLSIFDPKTSRFTSLKKENGLPDNSISAILEDNQKNLWVSTSNGLCRVTVLPHRGGYNFEFKNFDDSDGLQGREFNINAALKTSKGELIFGGGHGFNIFDPLTILPDNSKPKLVFTDFQLFNKIVSPGENIQGHVILPKAILATHTITLYHSENVFTFEFAALNFFNPSKIKYRYTLDGFDKGWLTADNTVRKATYTNLDGGDYVFKVQASNPNGAWNPDIISLKIVVKPPFWKSSVAYIIYILVVIGGIFLLRRRGIQKIRRQFIAEQKIKETEQMIEHERREVERIHEIDKLKIKFLTNVSHEFRTPLSLIMAPVDKLLVHELGANQKQQLDMIKKNARRLLNLVNQLLDFRKMEVHELTLHTRPGDIIEFVKEIVLSFGDIADKKGLALVFDTEVDTFKTRFDHDKIERIIFNLLSNAFKFTHSGGQVSVLLSLVEKPSAPNLQFIEIKIIDTGIGIPKDKQQMIFDRFFQDSLPDSILNQGSGIGLAITKEFVSMHDGEISVESEPGQGSCFTIRLPMPINDSEESNDIIDDEQLYETLVLTNADMAKASSKTIKKQTVLLVEDNEDFRFYLKDNLKESFHIIEAPNGKEGWQKALALHPDIIVSDISMPEMNGKELCQKIKNDERTSHIPIILLTALIGEEEELKGT